MRVKCYSVRVASIAQISPKAYKISSFNGSEDIIPTSCVYGYDYDVVKCDAYWIASWILEKKNLQYSDKKVAWFDKDTRAKLPTFKVEKHTPSSIEAVADNELQQLKRDEPIA